MYFTFTVIISLPADVYFMERDTQAFRTLQGKILQLGQMNIIQTVKQNEDTAVVRLITRPAKRKYVPEAVVKRFPFLDISFEDRLEYHTHLASGPSFEILFHSVPSVFPEKIGIHGNLVIRPLTEHSCTQTISGEVDIKLFGFKNFIESIIVESVSKSYEKLPMVITEWLHLRETILQTEGVAGLLSGAPDLDWLPNSAERKVKCLQYHSPHSQYLTQRVSELSAYGSTQQDHESNFADSELNTYYSKAADSSANLSSTEFHDALESLHSLYFSIPEDILTSFRHAIPTTKLARNGLLEECMTEQLADSSDSEDEIIRKNSIARPIEELLEVASQENIPKRDISRKSKCCPFHLCRHSNDVKRRCIPICSS